MSTLMAPGAWSWARIRGAGLLPHAHQHGHGLARLEAQPHYPRVHRIIIIEPAVDLPGVDPVVQPAPADAQRLRDSALLSPLLDAAV